jgi:hypothetical protein
MLGQELVGTRQLLQDLDTRLGHHVDGYRAALLASMVFVEVVVVAVVVLSVARRHNSRLSVVRLDFVLVGRSRLLAQQYQRLHIFARYRSAADSSEE